MSRLRRGIRGTCPAVRRQRTEHCLCPRRTRGSSLFLQGRRSHTSLTQYLVSHSVTWPRFKVAVRLWWRRCWCILLCHPQNSCPWDGWHDPDLGNDGRSDTHRFGSVQSCPARALAQVQCVLHLMAQTVRGGGDSAGHRILGDILNTHRVSGMSTGSTCLESSPKETH